MPDETIETGDQTSVGTTVAGLPVRAGLNGDGYFATAAFQTVTIAGSPLVVTLSPPVATIEQVSAPALLGLIAALVNGAIIQS